MLAISPANYWLGVIIKIVIKLRARVRLNYFSPEVSHHFFDQSSSQIKSVGRYVVLQNIPIIMHACYSFFVKVCCVFTHVSRGFFTGIVATIQS